MAIDQRAIVIAHGVLASLSWVIFFPLGSILLRVLDGKSTWKVHAFVQAFSMTVFIGAVGTGLQMAQRFRLLSNYHVLIGLLLFALMFTQSLSGLLHHLFFQRLHRRTIVSHVHVWLGRALITLGMINGGLGLGLLRAPRHTIRAAVIAYTVVAGTVWASWIAISFVVECVRARRNDGDQDKKNVPVVPLPSRARGDSRWVARQRRLEERRSRIGVVPSMPEKAVVRDPSQSVERTSVSPDEKGRVRAYVIENVRGKDGWSSRDTDHKSQQSHTWGLKRGA